MSRSPSDQSYLRYPLSTMLSSPGQVRILRELFRHGGELSASTVAERIKGSRTGVYRTLAGLEAQRILEAIGSGHLRLFKANVDHPLAPSLDAMFRAEEARFDAVIECLREAAEAAAAKAAWLYGSVARGDDVVSSDVDLAVVSETETLSDVVEGVRERLRDAEDRLFFHASVVGVDTDDVLRLSKGDPWWSDVVRDALTLVGDSPEMIAGRLQRKRIQK